MDEDHSGLISIDELKHAYKKDILPDIEDEQLELIIKRIDYDNNGEINFTEFLSGTLREDNLSKENLEMLFKQLDVLNEECLTKESLLKVF